MKPKIDNAPGLIWRPRKGGHEARWQARSDLTRRGYEPKSVALWKGSDLRPIDIATIQRQCRDLQTKMLVWSHTNQLPAAKKNNRGMTWILAHLAHEEGNCLIWPYGKSNGYGIFCHEGRTQYVHRVMCEMVNGPAPSEKHEAAHSCGQGRNGCVHPKHVEWKTASENQLDRTLHGTQSRGRRGSLTPEQVEQIRALKGIKSQSEIAALVGTSRSNVSWIQCDRGRTKPVQGYVEQGGKYVARIKVQRQLVIIGTFDTPEAAQQAYQGATIAVQIALDSQQTNHPSH